MSPSLPCSLNLSFPHWISTNSWHRCNLSTSLQTVSLLRCVVLSTQIVLFRGLWKYQREAYPQPSFAIFFCFHCGQTITFSACPTALCLSHNHFVVAVCGWCAYESDMWDGTKSFAKSRNVTSLALLLFTRPVALWQKEIKLIWQDLFSANPY